MRTHAYLYKWTHILSNKWYIESRTKQGCFPNDGYICSSKVVKPMILENQNDWKHTILVISNPQYIRELETSILVLLDAANDPMSFNRHNSNGKFSTAGLTPHNKGKAMLVSQKEKISKAKLGKPGVSPSIATRQKLSICKTGNNNPMFGKIAWNKGLTGYVQTDESNKKRSNALKGIPRSIETTEKIRNTKLAKKAKKLNNLSGTLIDNTECLNLDILQ